MSAGKQCAMEIEEHDDHIIFCFGNSGRSSVVRSRSTVLTVRFGEVPLFRRGSELRHGLFIAIHRIDLKAVRGQIERVAPAPAATSSALPFGKRWNCCVRNEKALESACCIWCARRARSTLHAYRSGHMLERRRQLSQPNLGPIDGEFREKHGEELFRECFQQRTVLCCADFDDPFCHLCIVDRVLMQSEVAAMPSHSPIPNRSPTVEAGVAPPE